MRTNYTYEKRPIERRPTRGLPLMAYEMESWPVSTRRGELWGYALCVVSGFCSLGVFFVILGACVSR